MRWWTLLFFFFLNSFVFGQKKISGNIYDGLTGKPLPGICFYILRDDSKFIDIGETDSTGHFTGMIDKENYKKKSTYQVRIDEDMYNIVTTPVDTKKNSDIRIKLSANPYYFSKVNGMIYKDCWTTYFGNYEPKEPRGMIDLPEDIRKRVEDHLVNRVGPDFYKRLVLSGGQLVDLDRFQKLEKYKRRYHWIPYSYYLCFSFSDTTLGIARYTSQLVLDKKGNVIEEIELPHIATDTAKRIILSIKNAEAIASGLGHFNKNTYTNFYYDFSQDCFVWSFTERFRNKEEQTYIYKELLLAAHNGKILSNIYKSGRLLADPLFNSFR